MALLLRFAAFADHVVDRLTCLCHGHDLSWHVTETGETVCNCYGEVRKLGHSWAVCTRGRCGKVYS